MADDGGILAFDTLFDQAGIEIIDRLEQLRYQLQTPTEVTLEPLPEESFLFPVGKGVRIETDAVVLPSPASIIIRNPDDSMVAEIEHLDSHSLPEGPYIFDPSIQVKTYLEVTGPVEITAEIMAIRFEFADSTRVDIWARSRYTRPAATVTTTGDVKILHVDDDPQIIELTAEFLERTNEQFSVVGEMSAVEAINRLQEEETHCIVGDYDMPHTDGFEFLAIVREQYPDLPFILYTAKGSEEVASEAISAGVTEYMQKKTSTEQYEILANRIRNAVERYRSQQRFRDALSWYHRLIEQNIAGVFIVQDGEFVYMNEQLADILGYVWSELLAESPLAIASTSADEAAISEALESVDDQSHTFNRTFTSQCADGTEVSVEAQGGSIRYSDDPACVGILWRMADA